jgi:hypothetical protein
MGVYFLDQYTLLHFASGIVANYWGISIELWILINVLFELIENTVAGVKFIDTYIPFWPGGKLRPDTLINSFSDVLFGAAGWYLADINKKYFDKST